MPKPSQAMVAPSLRMGSQRSSEKVRNGVTLHDSGVGERLRISWSEGFISPKKDPSMSIHPSALAVKVSRAIDLSNDRLLTLVVLIQGLINARTVNLTHLAGTFHGPAKLS